MEGRYLFLFPSISASVSYERSIIIIIIVNCVWWIDAMQICNLMNKCKLNIVLNLHLSERDEFDWIEMSLPRIEIAHD